MADMTPINKALINLKALIKTIESDKETDQTRTLTWLAEKLEHQTYILYREIYKLKQSQKEEA